MIIMIFMTIQTRKLNSNMRQSMETPVSLMRYQKHVPCFQFNIRHLGATLFVTQIKKNQAASSLDFLLATDPGKSSVPHLTVRNSIVTI